MAAPERELALEALGACTRLWGGIHHPITILDQATRTRVGQQERFREPAEDEILSLFKDFDVDHVVTLGSDELPGFLQPAFAKRHITRERLSQEVWRPPQAQGAARRFLRFLEVWPFVDDFWRHELEGRSENRLRVVTDVHAADEAFAAAQFGRYSTDGPARYLRERLGAEAVTYNADWWQQFKFGKWLFPIDLTQLSLSSYGQAAFFNAALYLCNPADLFDVIDYWNLRAAGMTVIPLPAPRYKEYARPVQTFVAATKRELPQGFEGAEGQIIKARSITDELLKEVATGRVKQQKHASRSTAGIPDSGCAGSRMCLVTFHLLALRPVARTS